MRFLTWNIQSGGGQRVAAIVAELHRLAPDFIALTEVTSKNLDTLRNRLTTLGYSHTETTCAEGTSNSVLIASKRPITRTDETIDHDGQRWLPVTLDGLDTKVLSVHIPGSDDNKFGADGFGISGKRRKEIFWDEVITYAHAHRDERVVILGDFNTGLAEDAQGTPFVHSDFIRVLRLEKYVDTWRSLHPGARDYTWYSRRKNKETGISEEHNGFRLDYIYVSRPLHGAVQQAAHVHTARIDRTSDHSIVVADLAVD